MENYISTKINNYISQSSWTRKMFELGSELKKKFGDDNVFDFSLGNPDVPPPPAFYDVFQKINIERNPQNQMYMPNAGYPAVRAKLGEHLSKIYNKKISADNIIMTCGAAAAMNITLKTIIDDKDEVIIIAPYFAEYLFYVLNHNGRPVIAESDINFDIDIKNIKKVITDKTRAIIINSPNNPTGKVYSKKTLIELANVLKSCAKKYGHAIYIISDEPYRNIIYGNVKVPSILEIYENSIVVNSYSKDLSLPGERIGYVLINPDCKGKKILFDGMVLCNRICGFVNAPATMQRIVAELLNEKVNISLYKKRRDIFYNELKKIGYKLSKPDGAFYFFVQTPFNNKDDVAFVEFLLKYNILVVPGIGCGRAGYFRIAYCVNENIINKSLPFFKKAFDEK